MFTIRPLFWFNMWILLKPVIWQVQSGFLSFLQDVALLASYITLSPGIIEHTYNCWKYYWSSFLDKKSKSLYMQADHKGIIHNTISSSNFIEEKFWSDNYFWLKGKLDLQVSFWVDSALYYYFIIRMVHNII